MKSNISLAKKEQQNMDNMINEKGEMSDANEQREKLAKDTNDKTIHSSIQELKHVINRSQNRLSEDMILINNHLRTVEKMSQKNNIVTPSKTTKAACRDQETLSQYVRRRRNVNYKPSTKRAKTVADAHKALQVFTSGWRAIWNPDNECYFFVSRDMKEVSPFVPDPTASAVLPSARRGTRTIDIDINSNLVNLDEMSSELFKTVDNLKKMSLMITMMMMIKMKNRLPSKSIIKRPPYKNENCCFLLLYSLNVLFCPSLVSVGGYKFKSSVNNASFLKKLIKDEDLSENV